MAMDAYGAEALRRHLGRVMMEPLAPPATGLVSLDRTGRDPVLTAVTLDGDGTPSFVRRRLPAHGLPDDPGEAMRVAAALVSEGGMGGVAMTASEGMDWFGLRGRESGVATLFADTFALCEPDAAVDPGFLVTTMDAAVARVTGAVAAGLDGEALHALRACEGFGMPAYAFYATKGEKRAARHQAAEAYPLLATAFAGKMGLRMAIDSRRPLAAAMEKAFGVDERDMPRLTRPLQKRLQGIDWPDGGVPLEAVIETLSAMPPDWFPKTADEWSAFLDLADTLFRKLPPIIGATPAELAAGCGGKWVEFRRRVAKAAAPTQAPGDLTDEEKAAWRPTVSEDRETLAGAAIGVLDMVRHFRDLVVLPVAATEANGDVPLSEETKRIADEVAGKLLCRGKSLPAILETQRQWHTRSGAINVAVRGEDTDHKERERERKIAAGELRLVPPGGWAPLCPVVVAPNGVTVMPLVTKRELEDEGRDGPNDDGTHGLHHCVGTNGYDQKCKKGSSHIVSFRDYDGDGFRRLSTAEFGAIEPASNKLDLLQHQCNGNGGAPQRARSAYSWFKREVEAGNIPINRDGVMALMMTHDRPVDDVVDLAGYDRRNRNVVDTAVGAWAPLLDKRLRGADVDALHALPEMEDLVEAVAPAFRRSPR